MVRLGLLACDTLPGLRSVTGRQYATGNQQSLLLAGHASIPQDVSAFYVIVSTWKLPAVGHLVVVVVISVIKLHASLRSDNSSVVCCVKPTGWSALHKEIPNIDLQPVGGA